MDSYAAHCQFRAPLEAQYRAGRCESAEKYPVRTIEIPAESHLEGCEGVYQTQQRVSTFGVPLYEVSNYRLEENPPCFGLRLVSRHRMLERAQERAQVAQLY